MCHYARSFVSRTYSPLQFEPTSLLQDISPTRGRTDSRYQMDLVHQLYLPACLVSLIFALIFAYMESFRVQCPLGSAISRRYGLWF